jgi:hypothetical protein
MLDKLGSRSSLVDFFLHQIKNQRNPIHTFEIIRDYLSLKNNFYFLKKNIKLRANNKKILIVSLSDFIYQVKTEAMLAKALQLEGCEIIVLTWRHSFWPKRYFKLFGIDRFVDFDVYFKKWKEYNCQEESDNFLKEKITFQEVKRWRFKNCRLGQQVLSTLARRMFGTPNLSKPNIHQLFIYFLKRQIRYIYAAEELLDRIKPDTLLFNEANDSIYGGIFDLACAKGMDVIQFVQPLRDDALIFKRYTPEAKGLHPNSLSKDTFEKIKCLSWMDSQEKALWQEFNNLYGGKWFLSGRNQIGTIRKSKEEIIRQLGIDAGKKIVIVFSHVLWDANLFYGEDLFEDYEDWFIETLRAACNNSKVNWIIKLHPANIWKRNRDNVRGQLREIVLIKDNIGRLPAHVHLLYPQADINTFSLFNLVDYGITVRGTVGMELPCFGKPVFTAGTGRYFGLGFTIDSKSRYDYLDKLSRIQEFPSLSDEQTLLAKKHYYAVFCLRPWLMQSFSAEFNYKKRGLHPLDHNLYPKVESLEELSNARDFKKFSDWVLYSKDSDYLESNF